MEGTTMAGRSNDDKPAWAERWERAGGRTQKALAVRIDPKVYAAFYCLFKAMQKRYGGEVTQGKLVEQALDRFVKYKRRSEPDLEADPVWTPIKGRRPEEP